MKLKARFKAKPRGVTFEGMITKMNVNMFDQFKGEIEMTVRFMKAVESVPALSIVNKPVHITVQVA